MASLIRPVIQVDTEKCVNCHRCISVCPAKMCNDGSKNYVSIIHELCIGCGKCIEACSHGARSGIDDFNQFLSDRKNGVKMVAVISPAAAVSFKGRDLELNAWLKSIGVEAFFDASFGAELATKSYAEYMKKKNPKLVVSQTCPSLVTFCEIYRPNLLPYLSPVDSPIVCTIKMIKKFYPQYKDYKVVIVSPCYSERREMDETECGDYNITFKSIDAYFKEKQINLNSLDKVLYMNPPAERGVGFSTPGGFIVTAERYIPGITAKSRKIAGLPIVAEYLVHLEKSLAKTSEPIFKLVDCLACVRGCNGGAGTVADKLSLDEMESYVEKRKEDRQKHWKTNTKFGKLGLNKLNKTINSYWEENLYTRKYENRHDLFLKNIKRPSDLEIKEIQSQMGQNTSREILDCAACGYKSCEQMAVAIFNGLNIPENCYHFKAVQLRRYMENRDEEIHKIIHSVKSSSISHLDKNDFDVNDIEEASISMVESVSDSSEAIEEMISNIKSINTILGNNVNSIDGLLNATKEGEASIKEISELISEIEEKSNGLSEMSKVIQQISSQTNLLAMNAAIEAAHAGEFGTGFSVVADEIRKLAENSGKEAKQISQVLKKIKALIDAIFSKTISVQKDINNIVSLADEVSSQEKIVKKAVSEQNDGSQQLLDFLKNMKMKTSSVTDAVEKLRESSGAIKDAIQNIDLTMIDSEEYVTGQSKENLDLDIDLNIDMGIDMIEDLSEEISDNSLEKNIPEVQKEEISMDGIEIPSDILDFNPEDLMSGEIKFDL